MKIYLDTVGCRLNQSEIEMMAWQFRAAGHEIVATADGADLAVVNTCAVTAQAASDSRASIRRAAGSSGIRVIATGCWTSLQPTQAAALPKVSRVVVNEDKDQLVARVLERPQLDFDVEPIARQPLPGAHRRTRAFIKVQDGCNNRCTFCITTLARGGSRSRQIGAVIRDAQSALEGGTKEIVLTGVHLGSWGQEFGTHLKSLVRAILDDTDVPRLRLSSLEPWDLDEDFFTLWEDPRMCPHVHLPLQSGCEATLRRMSRRTTPASFRRLVAFARRASPALAITTDVIAGFPGETSEEFEESLEFLRQMEFAGGHAFTYSPRPGTVAARLTTQIAPQVRRHRNAVYRSLFDAQSAAYRRKFLGRAAEVLWESTTPIDSRGWRLEGLMTNHIRVSALSLQPRWNQIDPVKLTGRSAAGLEGVILKSG
jgi:threonylcarbamoyladenosine tRNA methylthiotransferase MtaB